MLLMMLSVQAVFAVGDASRFVAWGMVSYYGNGGARVDVADG